MSALFDSDTTTLNVLNVLLNKSAARENLVCARILIFIVAINGPESNSGSIFYYWKVTHTIAVKHLWQEGKCMCRKTLKTLQWRHNGWDSVSNHQPHDCLLNRLFRHRSNNASKLRVNSLCVRGIHRRPHKWPVTRKKFKTLNFAVYVLPYHCLLICLTRSCDSDPCYRDHVL